MADGVTVRLTGIDDLKRAVDALRNDLRKKVVRGALRDAAKPIVAAAKANAPVLRKATKYRTPGLLRKSIVVRSSKVFNGRNGELGVYISVRGKKGARRGARSADDPFYWRFSEFGTRKMAKRPFLLPAFKSQAGAALRIFQSRLKERIDQANRRK